MMRFLTPQQFFSFTLFVAIGALNAAEVPDILNSKNPDIYPNHLGFSTENIPQAQNEDTKIVSLKRKRNENTQSAFIPVVPKKYRRNDILILNGKDRKIHDFKTRHFSPFIISNAIFPLKSSFMAHNCVGVLFLWDQSEQKIND